MSLIKNLKQIYAYNMGFRKGDSILIVTDPDLDNIGDLFFRAGLSLGAETMLLKMKTRNENGEEPPVIIANAMINSDIVMMPTSKSLSHTSARRSASSSGARIASMPGITMPILKRMLEVDYEKLKSLTKKIGSRLKTSTSLRILTEIGTDITMDIKKREVHEDIGLLSKKGRFGNLPAGEADLSPREGTAEGQIYFDGSALRKKLEEPIKVTVKNGIAVKFEGSKTAKELEKTLRSVGKKAFNIAEIGIGTNKFAKLTGNILEDEKVYGTCHIAFGNNKSYGGKVDVPIHLDCVIKKPDIYLDNKIIMKKGKLKI
ncbi:aminopeptidase [Candidatus Woesearchaeota archaeon]|nr:aminopeptidase [Candidatus Woesearchaeota archaeon]